MLTVAEYDEKTLLAMVASGDRHAFKQLYSTHLNNLYRFVFLFTGSKEETEDILQEIFVRIWEDREQLLGIDSLKNYLYRTAKNKVLDNFRHLRVKQRVLTEIGEATATCSNTTKDQHAYREYYLLVQQAIEKLPPRRKLIFRLNIENGLSQDEIAEQLNISRSVVQKQIYKATYYVREYLFKHGELSFSLLISLLLMSF